MSQPEEKPVRIAKRIADCGICSRREAERMIEAGRVILNGQTLKTPAITVTSKDKILVDNKPITAPAPVQLWRYYKPAGLVVTNKDEKGRETIYDHLPKDMPRVISVGRLDLATEGLLLLTTSGALARHLEIPATGWLRRYRVRAFGKVKEADLEKLAQGVTIDGVRYRPITAILDKQQGANSWLTFALKEGKNREIRKVCEHLGLKVNRLIRLSYGPFSLTNLKKGEVALVKNKVLTDQLGPKLSQQLNIKIAPSQKSNKKPRKPGGKMKRRGQNNKPTPHKKPAKG